MPHELPIWALSLGFTLFCFVAIVAAGVWEKRRIQTFSIPAAGSERPLTEYGRLTNETLRQLGYAFHGTFHDARINL